MPGIVVAAFYKFFDFPDFAERRQEYKDMMREQDIRGSVLLASEGINATIAGSRQAVDAFLAHLRSDPRMADLAHKESFCDLHPFKRIKVRLKKETISFGHTVDMQAAEGTHVGTEQWNRLLEDEEVVVLDTRNAYETHVGSFKNAMTFDVEHFKQLPENIAEKLDSDKHKKVAMYCTGGIRCEKFAGYMLDQGFEEVYQLEGGILKYLEEVPEEKSLWQGGCFVFDSRVAVGHGIEVCEDITMCHACGAALLPQDKEMTDDAVMGCIFCLKKHGEEKNTHI